MTSQKIHASIPVFQTIRFVCQHQRDVKRGIV